MGREQRGSDHFARQGVSNRAHWAFPSAYLCQYSVRFPYLLLHEGVGFAFDHYVFLVPIHFPPQHLSYRASVFRMPYGQRPEVMDPHQKLGCLRHLLSVQVLPDPEMGVAP